MKTTKRLISKLALLALALQALSPFLSIQAVHAASASAMSDTLNREKVGVASVGHTLLMTLPSFTFGTTVSLNYGTPGFTLDAGALGAMSIGSGTVTAVASATGVDITCTVGPCSGDFTGTFTGTNPGSTGSKLISISSTNGSGVTGSFAIPIVDEDQISITASVDPAITFNVGSQSSATACDGTFADNGGTVTLGALLTSAVTTSGHSSPGSPVGTAAGTAFDAVHSRLFVSSYAFVAVFDISGGISDNMPASFMLGQPTVTTSGGANHGSGFADGSCNVGDGTPNPCGLYNVAGLAYDATGNRLFVIDQGNSRVMVFDVSTITNGEPAINVLGQPDFSTVGVDTQNAGNGCITTPNACGMNVPQGVTYDASGGRLFVGEGGNNRVMVFAAGSITNGEAATSVLGQPDFLTATTDTQNAGNGCTTTPNACGMNQPQALAYAATGSRLFVGDTANNRVTAFSVASITDGEAAVNVLGQPDFLTATTDTQNAGNGCTTTPNACGMNQPYSLAYDPSGNRLFVGDMQNSRVTAFSVASVTDGEPAVNVLGQPDFTTFAYNRGSGFNDASCNVGDGTPNPCAIGLTFGVAYDPTGNRIFVSNFFLDPRVAQFDASFPAGDGEPYQHVLFAIAPAGVIPHICTRVSTNATLGAVVTVKSANASLKSVSTPADAIPSSTAALTAGSEGYGLCAGTDGSDAGTYSTDPVSDFPVASSPFDGACTATDHNVGALTTSPQAVWSVVAPSSNAFYFLFLKAAIAGTTKAHADYTDTLTFVATGTF